MWTREHVQDFAVVRAPNRRQRSFLLSLLFFILHSRLHPHAIMLFLVGALGGNPTLWSLSMKVIRRLHPALATTIPTIRTSPSPSPTPFRPRRHPPVAITSSGRGWRPVAPTHHPTSVTGGPQGGGQSRGVGGSRRGGCGGQRGGVGGGLPAVHPKGQHINRGVLSQRGHPLPPPPSSMLRGCRRRRRRRRSGRCRHRRHPLRRAVDNAEAPPAGGEGAAATAVSGERGGRPVGRRRDGGGDGGGPRARHGGGDGGGRGEEGGVRREGERKSKEGRRDHITTNTGGKLKKNTRRGKEAHGHGKRGGGGVQGGSCNDHPLNTTKEAGAVSEGAEAKTRKHVRVEHPQRRKENKKNTTEFTLLERTASTTYTSTPRASRLRWPTQNRGSTTTVTA